MRHLAAALGILAWATAGARADGPDPSPLRVMIDVPERYGERPLQLEDAETHFHVVLLNGSGQPVRLWAEWCSWGAENLRLELTLPDGKRTTIRKHPLAYKRNAAAWFTLGPGEATVREVYPLSMEPRRMWDQFPEIPPGKTLRVKLRAVFEIPRDAYTEQRGVWAGRVESKELEVLLSRV